VLGGTDYAELVPWRDKLMARMQDNPGLANVQSNYEERKPQLRVAVDRDRAADLGISLQTVGRTLETVLGSRIVTTFVDRDREYNVILQGRAEDRATPTDLDNLYVRSDRTGELIPLSNLVTLTELGGPTRLNRFDRLRSITVSAALTPGHTLGEALGFVEKVVKEDLPPSVRLNFDGQSREFKVSSSSLALTFVLALAFIYLVLAAQFESFRDPFIIMLTVPLSMAGALLALWLSGGTLNVYSQIGLVTLVGLITKHGILIVEFANQLQEKGLELKEAVIESATLRLRPILMTTGAMVLGALPLALASGAGAESRQQIGWVIVGGLLLGTLLTLFVIPVAYTLLTRNPAAGTLSPAHAVQK